MSHASALPTVSVVIPAYNAAQFIGETLEHAIAQTYPNLEILVIDDGSTDETAEIASSFDDRVRVISTKNQGVAKARNTGIDAASGEFLAFLDADDLWEPDKIALQVEAVDDDHRLIYSDMVSFGTDDLANMYMSADENLPSGEIRAQLIERNFITTSSVLLDREIAVRVGGFNPTIPVCDDWDYWLRALALTHAKFVDRPLVRYRVHQTSLSSNTDKYLSGCLSVIKSGVQMLDLSASQKKSIQNKAIAQCYGHAALLARSGTQRLLPLKLYMKALWYYPNWVLVKEVIKTLLGPKLMQHIKPGYTV